MCAQLRRGLAVFGDIVDAHEVLGLAGIAFWPHAIALGLALSAALARNRRDLTTRRAEGIGAGNGGLVLPPRVYQGAPQTLLGSQRGLVVDSGGRCCLRAKDKVSLGSVEMEWTLAGGVPFGRILAEEGLARTEAGNAKRRCKRQREEKVKEAARGKSQQGKDMGQWWW